ncbi:nas-28 [Symbiodinium natans]|uniref:Nas-28 protein n=1 Tax=Symbiodinium natans TaxID=878477 RepID=A0A812PDH7_9DINO|nr:nas-28 [Symbiodinium natans]
MHYSDTAFGKTDADGKKMKTMEAVDSPYGSNVVMGNRMGLTHQDARQVGSMYGCLDEIDHFKLCTTHPEGCTIEDCGCHQDASALDEVIKTTDDQGCNRCQNKCPSYPYGTSGACGCPVGLQHGCFEIEGWNINGLPILEACATKCGFCDIPPPCMDVFSNCDSYTQYCNNPSVTMGGIPYPEACAKACGSCG